MSNNKLEKSFELESVGFRGAGPEHGFVSSYLLYMLAAASEAASMQFHAKVRARGVRVPEWRVLATLSDCDGEMITRLAAIALMEQSRLTKVIIGMEEKDLVSRQGDASDRRRVRVWLTEAGRSLAKDLVAEARAHEQSILSQLELGDGARLKSALASLLGNLSVNE